MKLGEDELVECDLGMLEGQFLADLDRSFPSFALS
jgi:hypothetical protein